jgi:hypothetical protein
MWNSIHEAPGSMVYFVMAISGTTLFVLKSILSLIGGHGDLAGHFDVAGDASHIDLSGEHGDVAHGDLAGVGAHPGHDGSTSHCGSEAAFRLLSIQSVLAFFMGMGWAGLAARVEWRLSPVVSLLVASQFGIVMTVLAAFLAYQIRRLDRAAVFDPETCVGTIGRVYLTVPSSGQGKGQVEVTISGRRRILPAVSEGEPIPAFSLATVVKVQDDGSLLIEKRGA